MKPGDYVRVKEILPSGKPREREAGYLGVIVRAVPRSYDRKIDDWLVEIFNINPPLELTYLENSLEVIRTAEEIENFLEGYL